MYNPNNPYPPPPGNQNTTYIPQQYQQQFYPPPNTQASYGVQTYNPFAQPPPTYNPFSSTQQPYGVPQQQFGSSVTPANFQQGAQLNYAPQGYVQQVYPQQGYTSTPQQGYVSQLGYVPQPAGQLVPESYSSKPQLVEYGTDLKPEITESDHSELHVIPGNATVYISERGSGLSAFCAPVTDTPSTANTSTVTTTVVAPVITYL